MGTTVLIVRISVVVPVYLNNVFINYSSKVAITTMVRKQREYRGIDRSRTLHLMGTTYKLLVKARPKLIPKFAHIHAMGIETIFK